MGEKWMILLIHQMIYQGMFITKNWVLRKKTGMTVRGKNVEANVSIFFFFFFIVISIGLSIAHPGPGTIFLLKDSTCLWLGLSFNGLSLIISARSLVDLKDSWRVGVIETQKTPLVISGIYTVTRNPYFVSYNLMFVGYTMLLQNMFLILLSIIGFILVHWMILKEERHLSAIHGDDYRIYQSRVPRYLFFDFPD